MHLKAPQSGQFNRHQIWVVLQIAQRAIKDVRYMGQGQVLPKQQLGPAISRNNGAIIIEDDQPGPLTVDVIDIGIKAEQEVFRGKPLNNKPILNRLRHQLDQS